MSDSGFDVQLVNDSLYEFYVKFKGPEESQSSVICLSLRILDAYSMPSNTPPHVLFIFHPCLMNLPHQFYPDDPTLTKQLPLLAAFGVYM